MIKPNGELDVDYAIACQNRGQPKYTAGAERYILQRTYGVDMPTSHLTTWMAKQSQAEASFAIQKVIKLEIRPPAIGSGSARCLRVR
jgi:outer membrane biogenesis lipoprotein LolB